MPIDQNPVGSDIEFWQIEQTKQAIAEAESGDFATLAELQAVLTKYDPPLRTS